MDYKTTEGRESLRIPDGRIFSRVMRSPELCRGLLERVFPEMEISRVEYWETEGIYSPTEAEGGLSLEVYRKDSPRICSVVLQTPRKEDFRRFYRYYNRLLLWRGISMAQGYPEETDLFVVFVCPEDPLGHGLRQYKIYTACKQVPEWNLWESNMMVVLNAAGKKGDVPPKLQAFLDYMAGQPVQGDPYIDSLDQAVREVKETMQPGASGTGSGQ